MTRPPPSSSVIGATARTNVERMTLSSSSDHRPQNHRGKKNRSNSLSGFSDHSPASNSLSSTGHKPNKQSASHNSSFRSFFQSAKSAIGKMSAGSHQNVSSSQRVANNDSGVGENLHSSMRSLSSSVPHHKEHTSILLSAKEFGEDSATSFESLRLANASGVTGSVTNGETEGGPSSTVAQHMNDDIDDADFQSMLDAPSIHNPLEPVASNGDSSNQHDDDDSQSIGIDDLSSDRGSFGGDEDDEERGDPSTSDVEEYEEFTEDDDVGWDNSDDGSITLALHDSASLVDEGFSYTLGHHCKTLRLFAERDRQTRYCDMTHLLIPSSNDMGHLVKDYISPVTHEELSEIYFGLEKTTPLEPSEHLPVRTLLIRIRPDVSSGQVMGSIILSLQETKHIVQKKQGGHFRAILIPSSSLPYILDAQLCTSRSFLLERHIMLRIFHISADMDAQVEAGDAIQAFKNSPPSQVDFTAQIPYQINLHLKEACSFWQLVDGQQTQSSFSSFKSSNLNTSPSPMPTATSTSMHFMDNFKETISVQGDLQKYSGPILPALCPEDWALLQASWPLNEKIIERLNEDACRIDTLTSDHPWDMKVQQLDNHYCSQIRQLSRQAMITELRMALSSLETQLETEENSYSLFLELLEASWDWYNVEKPEYVARSPSAASAPEELCRPGFTIAAFRACQTVYEEHRKEEMPSLVALADAAVRRIYETFSRADEEELHQYLKIKHTEVTERLLQIKEAQRNILKVLDENLSKTEGKIFGRMAREALNSEGRCERHPKSRVPLLELSTTSSGMCYVTARQILIVKKGLFSQTVLYDLKAVEFEEHGGMIQVNWKGQKLNTFKPAKMDVDLLLTFLATLKEIAKG